MNFMLEVELVGKEEQERAESREKVELRETTLILRQEEISRKR